MAISQQFTNIVKNHPELVQQSQTGTGVQKPAAPKVNPFKNMKQSFSAQQQPAAIVPSAGTPFSTVKPAMPKTIVMDEDNNDDDPALIAVADKPSVNSVPEGNVTVRQAATEEKAKKAEEKKEEVKVEPVKQEEPKQKTEDKQKAEKPKKAEESKDLLDYVPEEDKNPEYFKNNIDTLRQRYVDEEFNRYQEEISKRLEGIKITPDLNTGTVKVRLADISALRQEIFKHRVTVKMLLQCPLDKEHGDLYASAKIQAKGSNETERKSNYFQYLKNFPVKNGSVDIPFLSTVLDMYNIFFDAVLAELRAKQEALAIYTGNLKIDATLA